MRLIGLVALLVSLAACASTAPVQPDAQGITYAPPGVVACEQRLTFDNDDGRVSFLRANTERIVAHTATEQVFIEASQRGPALSIVRAMDACPAEGLAAALELAGDYAHTQSLVEANAVFARMTQGAFASVDATNQAAHQCVVHTPDVSGSDAHAVSARLVFAGLRRVQVIGADEVIYVSADENCALLAHFLSASIVQAFGSPREVTQCSNANLEACGYR